jgi:hypothetical protein
MLMGAETGKGEANVPGSIGDTGLARIGLGLKARGAGAELAAARRAG